MTHEQDENAIILMNKRAGLLEKKKTLNDMRKVSVNGGEILNVNMYLQSNLTFENIDSIKIIKYIIEIVEDDINAVEHVIRAL